MGRREARAEWGPITIAGVSQRLMCSGWVTPKDGTHTTLYGDRLFQSRERGILSTQIAVGGRILYRQRRLWPGST